MRRCRKREDAVLMLSSLGEAHPRFLARAIDVDPVRLRRIMSGHPPEYRIELSPISLGLATLVQTPTGMVYRITERGRKRARQLASAKVRDAAARRARSEVARRDTEPARVGPPGVPSPGPGWSYSCTFTSPP